MTQSGKVLKLYDQSVLIPLDEYDPVSDSYDFSVLTGSRMLSTLYIKSISPGASIQLVLSNSFSVDGRVSWEELSNITVNQTGYTKRVFTDFNKFFNYKIIVTGGTVEYALSLSIFDNAVTQHIEGGEIIDKLNKLVPEYYDDVEVLSLTPGKQPINIQFRRGTEIIRNVQITYLDEVFIRARIV